MLNLNSCLLLFFIHIGFDSGFAQNELFKNETNFVPCECYMLGTIETKHGVSKCNQNGVCDCLPNVIGKNCDKCRSGYYGILNGKGCKACDCDLDSSESVECHKESGQCLCKDGYTGLKCNLCDIPLNNETPPSNKKCTTPCDIHRSLDPLFLHENGTCACKPNANGVQCSNCNLNYYLNTTTSACTKCPACYTNLEKKLNQLQENLQEIQPLINEHLQNSNNTNYEYEFLIKLKTLQNKICAMLNNLLKLPQIKEIVKLKNFETILDLTEQSIHDLNFYLNGHINFAHLEKKLQKLDNVSNVLSDLIEKQKELPNVGEEKLEQVLEHVEKEVEGQAEHIHKIDDEMNLLKQDVDRNYTSAKYLIQEFKGKELDELKENNFDFLEDAEELLLEAKEVNEEANENNKFAKELLEKVNKLNLPEMIQNEIEPILNGTFEDLTGKIEKAKRKFDLINEFLKILNETELNPLINGTTNKNLINRKNALIFRLQDIVKTLEKQLEDLNNSKNKFNSDITTINQNITQLNSDIDEKYKELTDLLEKIDEDKQNAHLSQEDFDRIKDNEAELMKLLEKLKNFRKKHQQIRQDIDDMNHLLQRIREIFAIINTSKKTLKEFKVFIKKYKNLIAHMEELIRYLELIPVDQFDEIERLMDDLEEFLQVFHTVQQLRADVEKVRVFLGQLPEGRFIDCTESIVLT